MRDSRKLGTISVLDWHMFAMDGYGVKYPATQASSVGIKIAPLSVLVFVRLQIGIDSWYFGLKSKQLRLQTPGSPTNTSVMWDSTGRNKLPTL